MNRCRLKCGHRPAVTVPGECGAQCVAASSTLYEPLNGNIRVVPRSASSIVRYTSGPLASAGGDQHVEIGASYVLITRRG